MGCGCEKDKPKHGGKSFTKAVVEIVNPEKITLLRKVIIPASLGDETTIPPAVGDYHNVILYYEASKRVYLYSSDGIPTLIGTDVSVLEETVAKLQEDLAVEITDREGADTQLSNEIADVASDLADETTVRETADSALDARITDNSTRISGLTNSLADEISNRQNADTNLQGQIDAISASSDVKDIVGTYAELQNYDASTLGDNDIIKVLQDETQNGATTYYRWNSSTQRFTLIGEEGPFYTKSEADSLLATKQNVLTAGNNIQINGTTISATDTTYSAGNGLNLTGTTFSADTDVLQEKLTAGENISISNNTISATDTTYTAGDGLELDGTEFSIDNTVALKSELPTVNDATLTIQKNGSDVASFTANSGTNVTANISVPTDTAQLSNGAGFQTASDVATLISGKQNVLTPGNNIQINGNTISATDTTYSAGNGLNLTGTVFSADTDILQTKLTPGDNITIDNGVISSLGGEYTAGNGLELADNVFAIDDSVVALKSDIPVIRSASLTIQRNGVDVATFTTDSATPVTANIAVPTNNAQLTNGAGYQTASDVRSLIIGKQDVLTAGNNIQITGNTISATDTKYSAGVGLNLTGTVFSADTETLATRDYVNSSLPTDVSELNNDAGYITNTVNNLTNYTPTANLATVATSGSYNDLLNRPTIPAAQINSDWNAVSGVAQILNKPTNVSAFANDAGYLTSVSWGDVSGKPTFATVATSGSYNDLSDKPTIPTVPTNVSAFTNDAGYQNSAQVQNAISAAVGDITTLDYQVVQTLPATGVKGIIYLVPNSGTAPNVYDEYIWVPNRTDGSFEKIGTTEVDLSNYVTDSELTTTLAGYVQSSSLATVATSGAYSDLSGKPTIPTVNDATLTVQRNGTSVGTFTANASSNRTINIAVPTATSDLTNDSGFITSITKITNAEIDAIMGVA